MRLNGEKMKTSMHRLLAGLLGSALLFCTSLLSAQDTSLISGQNINMVSGTEWPNGDPFLQRQNEPSIAVGTRNPFNLLAGSNDYRSVDLPGLPDGKTIGDSWVSIYRSNDGGGRWTSTLLPGYPQDNSPEGLASPIKGFDASADPVVRSGTHGLFYYSGIAFTRDENPESAAFVSTYMDLNNDERASSIGYVRTTLYDENRDGAYFIDKPWIAVDKPRLGAQSQTFDVVTDDGPVSQTVDCGNLYAAWARIEGDGTTAVRSSIMFARSSDCGATFSTPVALNSPNTINQGASIAVDPLNGRIQVAWRQFENATMNCTYKGNHWRKNPDAWPVEEITLAGYRLTAETRGRVIVAEGDEDDSYDDYDDNDDMEDYDHDADKPNGVLRQLLAAWLNVLSGADSKDISADMAAAEAWLVENPIGSKPPKVIKREGNRLRKSLRDFNKGKIGPGLCEDMMGSGTDGMLGGLNPNAVMVVSSSDFGTTFSSPVAASDDAYAPFEQGTTEFSFRTTGYPTMTFDGEGRSYIAYSTRGYALTDASPVGGDARIVVTTSQDGNSWTVPQAIDEPSQPGHQLMPAFEFNRGKLFLLYYDFRADISGVFDRFIVDFPVDLSVARHSADVRAAQADAADVPEFTDYSVLEGGSTQTSRYPFLILDSSGEPFSAQMQYNPPNLPMFKGGTVPFFGDYIDIAAQRFIVDENGDWEFDIDPARGAPVVHAIWTDNRDVIGPPDNDWTSYVPPGDDTPVQSIFDPTQTRPVCSPGSDPSVADRTKMRNQNVYTSRLTQGIVLSVPGNNRELGTIPRAFVGFIQNSSNEDRLFRLEILNQPVGGSASFEQFGSSSVRDEVVERQSSIARTVYVTSSDPSAFVDLRATEIDPGSGQPVTGGLVATTRINPDPTAPAPDDNNILNQEFYTPAVFNPAVFNPAVFNPSLLGTDEVGIYNPAVFNPAVFNNPEAAEFNQAALAQLAILNPAVFNPAVFNPAVFNPAVFNPAVFNPAVFNPAVFNPAVFNPAVFNVSTANPAVFNPAVFNPAVFNGSIVETVETSVVIENTGNATAAYSLNLDLENPPAGFLYQVMVYKTYLVPSVDGCDLTETVEQEALVSELTPDVNGSLLNPDSTSFYVAPGDNVVVSLRIVPDPAAPGDPSTIDTIAELDLSQSVVPQAVDTVSVNNGETQPTPVTILAPSLPLLQINAVGLVDGTEGVLYTETLGFTGGGTDPVTWSVAPGTALPPGLNLSPAGIISGTPLAAGVFQFSVRATDGDQLATQGFSISVAPDGGGGTTFVDQQQPDFDTGVGFLTIGGGSEQMLAQVVTAGTTGSVQEVRFPLSCSAGDLLVQLQGVDSSGRPDGIVAASESIPAAQLPSFPGAPEFRSIAFSNPVAYNQGDQYAIVLSSLGNCGIPQGPQRPPEPYAPGDAFFDARPNAPGWILLDSVRPDLPFQVVVSEIQLYTFAFNNEIGNTAGTVTGTVRLDFIQAAIDSGTGPASDVRITSAPGAIPPNVEGDVATAWSTQSANTFTVANGNIIDYQFGPSEGAPPALDDNVLCLNTGAQFTVGGVYICSAGEHYFGDANFQVFNTDGNAGATFQQVNTAGQFAPAARYRAAFDLGADPANSQPPNPANFQYDCIRTGMSFNPSLPAGISFAVQIFETNSGNPISGLQPVGPFANPIQGIGFEVFNTSVPIPFGRGYATVEFSEPVTNLVDIAFSGQVPCNGSTSSTSFADGTITVQP